MPVLAVEPSRVMRDARHLDRPAIAARAEGVPIPDRSVDAAMAVLTIHHWHDVRQGLREMRRVSRGPVVILTYDMPVAIERLWIYRYLPEAAELDLGRFPTIASLVASLGGARVEVVPVPRDCIDGFLGAFWGRPEAHLDPRVQAANSALPQLPPTCVARAMELLAADLASGRWDDRYGWLRRRHELDVGLRLVVAGGTTTAASAMLSP